MRILSVFSLLLLLVSTSCKKEVSLSDTQKPIISITSPMSQDTFMVGDSIHIHGHASDNEGMHTVKLTLTDQTHSVVKINWEFHSHDNPAHFDTTYVVDTPIHSDLELKVEAEDENGNKAESSLFFHVHM